MTHTTRRAVEAAGGATKLAPQLIGRDGRPLSRQAVDQWSVIPPRHVLKIESLTGISRHVLRPDIYGPEPVPLARRRRAEARAA
jgi:DNA-binding transcriptional regulator YdaS (Cro superfamily)